MAKVQIRNGKIGVDFYDLQRRRHFIQAKPQTRRAADSLLARITTELNQGSYIAPDEQQNFDDLVAAYRTGHLSVKVRDTTAKWYEGALRNHLIPFFGEIKNQNGQTIRRAFKLQQIHVGLIEKFRADMQTKGKGVRTINKCLVLLGSMLRYAIKRRWITYNAASDVSKLREAHGQKQDALELAILTPAEINALLASTDDRYRVLLLAAALTGLRQGELLGLQWGDVDWQARKVYVRRSWSGGRMYDPKTKASRRRVPIPDELLTPLREWRLACPKGELDLVFPNGDGKPQHPSNLLRRGFFPALRRAGLRRIRFHDLRHTYASLLIAQGYNIKTVSTLMGHSSIKITMDVYTHLLPDATDSIASGLGKFIFSPEAVAGGKQMVSKAQARTAEVLKIA